MKIFIRYVCIMLRSLKTQAIWMNPKCIEKIAMLLCESLLWGLNAENEILKYS